METDKIYSIEDLSEVIGLQPTTIRRKASKGEIPCIKVWGRYYFSGEDVIKSMKKNGEKKGDSVLW